MKNNKVKKMLCGLCSIILLGGSCQAVPVMADMGNGNFVAVNDSVAVDSITVNGITVEALYRPYDSRCYLLLRSSCKKILRAGLWEKCIWTGED